METVPTTVSLYATRWKILLAIIVLAGFEAISVLFYFVWPTPEITANPWEYQEPFKTILFVVTSVFLAFVIVCGFYWVVTPLPMLELSPSQLVYRRFPRRTQIVQWDDMEDIYAVAFKRSTSPFTHNNVLIVWFTLNPHSVSAQTKNRTEMKMEIGLGYLSLHAEKLVSYLQNYHAVQFQDFRKWPKTRRHNKRPR